MLKFFIYFLVGSTLFFESITYSKENNPVRSKAYIETIEGAGNVTLVLEKKTRNASTGSEIEFGEKIKTGQNTSASIIYPDGSKVIVTANSEFKIEEIVEGSQWNRLYKGSVRGIIEKVNQPSKKPRFLIRSKSAVMGVRGTDFVISLDSASQSAQVHTLEGTVEVAKNDMSLLNGKGTPISEGQFIEGSKSGISAPQSFDKEQFLKSFDPKTYSSLKVPMIEDAASAEKITLATSSKVSTVSAEAYTASPPPQSIAAPTKFPPPLPPKNEKNDDSQRKTEIQVVEKTPRTIHILEFQAGIFYTRIDEQTYRSLSAAWTPTIPFPFIRPLIIRGHLGGEFAQDASLSQNFLIYDLQVYLVFNALGPLYFEGGIGRQKWQRPAHYDAKLTTFNAGLQIQSGPIEKVFIGYQTLSTRPNLDEFKAGIGILF